MPENKFEWSDDLVKDFSSHAMKSFENPNIYNDGKWEGLHTELDKWKRKKSKEKDIPNMDYKILKFGQTRNCDDTGDIRYPEKILRHSDDNIFSIGDNTNFGKITKFMITPTGVEVHFGFDAAKLADVEHKQKEKDIPKAIGYEIFVLEDKKITGVVRLSDNQIFEVGDEVKWRWLASPKEYVTIEGFYLDEEKRLIVKFKDWGAADQLFHIIMYMGFEKKVKPKERLYTTEEVIAIIKNQAKLMELCLLEK